MAKLAIKGDSSGVSLLLFIQDSASTTGAGKTGLAHNTSGLTCYYVRPGSTATSVSLVTQTVTGAWVSGGFVEIDATNMPGFYRFDIPNAALAAGVRSVGVLFKGATGMAPLPLEIDLGAEVVDPAGVTTLLSRIGTPSNLGSGATVAANLADIEGQTDDIGVAGAGLTALGDTRLANLDAAVSSRSTYAGGDTAGTTTLLSRVVGTIATGTHNAQSGDAFARLGAPAGASVSADVAAVKAQTAAIEVDTQDLQTQVGTDGAGLTNIPWNSAWDAEVQSEVADALAAYDPPTKAELDSAVANVSVDEIQASALADLFNTDSGTTYAAAVAGSVVKEIADNAGGSTLTEAGIADAVWDEALSGHAGAGSAGAALSAAGTAGDPWTTALPGAYGSGTAGNILGNRLVGTIASGTHNAQSGDAFARLGAPAGVSVSADVAAVKSDTGAIKTKTDYLPSATAGAAGGVFIAGSNAATSINTALTANITGNLSGSVGSVAGNVGGNVDGAVASVTAGVTLADDAITSAKFDESTAYPLKSADTGATAVARTGADGDTLETLSDQLDSVAKAGDPMTIAKRPQP